MKRSTVETIAAAGFFAVAIGVLVAWANPATAYEPSIYAGTPALTWLGFGVALAIAVGLALSRRDRDRALGIGLGSTAVTAVVSLPVVRNYRFTGVSDSLTHLGWTRDIVDGRLLPHELLYPGVHTIAAVFHHLGGVPIERGLLFTVVVLFVPFLLFVPLTARALSGGSGPAAGLAAIVSWMVLPVTNVATHMGIHTNSNALFLVPLVAFALVAYLRRRATLERLPLGLSPFGLLVFLAGIGLLLVHPQQMINVVLLVGTISAVQYLARRRFDDHPMLDHPTTYGYAVVLGAVFTAWTASDDRFRDALTGIATGALRRDVGTGATVDQRESSLQEVGGSLLELFVTMFLDAAVIALVVGGFVLLVWVRRAGLDPEPRSLVDYVAIGLVPLVGLFAVYFVGTPTMAFRQLGFVFVVLTILAGVALARAVDALAGLLTRPGGNAVAALVLGPCLVLGLATVFSSPLVYDPGHHVTDATMSGYASGLEHAADDVPHAGLGYDPYRYDHAVNGVESGGPVSAARTASGSVDAERFEAGNYSGAYHGDDYYLVVSEYDTVREFEVYRELHHSEESLEALETSPTADKVLSNDEFRMYAVSGDE